MNILLTCAGRRNYMVDYFKAVVEPFGGKVFVANSHSSAAFVPADSSFLVPEIQDTSYIKTLLQLCIQFKVNAIIPLFDIELPVLAEAKTPFFSQGVHVIVSSPEIIKICNDKWETKSFLESNGFHSPKTFLGLDTAIQAIEKKVINYPVVIKPRWGMGSIGVTEADNEAELMVLFDRTKKVIQSSYLNLESCKAPEMILIQEKLIGKEYGLDVISNLDGKYITTFVKRKISMRSGETDVAITEDDMELKELGQKIAEQLGHVAILDVDVFRTDKYTYILEMNPRFGGGYPFSHLAGSDIPAAIISWLQNEEPDPVCLRITPNVIGYKGVLPVRMAKSPINFTKNSR